MPPANEEWGLPARGRGRYAARKKLYAVQGGLPARARKNRAYRRTNPRRAVYLRLRRNAIKDGFRQSYRI